MSTSPPIVQRSTDRATAPNHHADHPVFSGRGGLLAAVRFSIGRVAAADLAIELAEVGPGDDVVDVGCGPGVAVRRAAAAGAAVAGAAPAVVMLRTARTLSAAHRRRRVIRYVSGTAEALPLGDASASVVWSL